jgi:hypothetical protein
MLLSRLVVVDNCVDLFENAIDRKSEDKRRKSYGIIVNISTFAFPSNG